jgi:hypothetical protein
MKPVISTDDALQRAVLAELSAAGMPAGHVGVAAHGGIVTLLGHVEHAAQKIRAESAALRLKDVKAVVVAIKIRGADTAKLHDDQIATEALTRLAWDTWVPPVLTVIWSETPATPNNRLTSSSAAAFWSFRST